MNIGIVWVNTQYWSRFPNNKWLSANTSSLRIFGERISQETTDIHFFADERPCQEMDEMYVYVRACESTLNPFACFSWEVIHALAND